MKHLNKEYREYFEFHSRIEVLEKGSSEYSFSGTIIDKDTFKAAKHDRKTEWKIAGISAVLTAVFLILTSPIFTHSLDPKTTVGAWSIWIEGIEERLSSAFLVSTAVSVLDVLLHWETIKINYPIQWEV